MPAHALDLLGLLVAAGTPVLLLIARRRRRTRDRELAASLWLRSQWCDTEPLFWTAPPEPDDPCDLTIHAA